MTQSAKWLMRGPCGKQALEKELGGEWKKNPAMPRPVGLATLHPKDKQFFELEVSRLGAKTILEFGPGGSTEVFTRLGLQITAIEHSQQWYEVAAEQFKDYPNVRVLKGEDEMPFVVPELDDSERFDLAFVDAPQGYFPRRKVHKGYEDCSRLNTTLFALQRAPVVLLHDAFRPLERGTLNRLRRMGYHVRIVPVPFGMARITHGDKNGTDTQNAKKPRRSAARAKPR